MLWGLFCVVFMNFMQLNHQTKINQRRIDKGHQIWCSCRPSVYLLEDLEKLALEILALFSESDHLTPFRVDSFGSQRTAFFVNVYFNM